MREAEANALFTSPTPNHRSGQHGSGTSSSTGESRQRASMSPSSSDLLEAAYDLFRARVDAIVDQVIRVCTVGPRRGEGADKGSKLRNSSSEMLT